MEHIKYKRTSNKLKDESGHYEFSFYLEGLGSEIACLECEFWLEKEKIESMTYDDLKILFFDWLLKNGKIHAEIFNNDTENEFLVISNVE